jgi:hypothetical protein
MEEKEIFGQDGVIRSGEVEGKLAERQKMIEVWSLRKCSFDHYDSSER